jgi:hypothetical protein
VGDDLGEIHEMLRQHDRCWSELALDGLGALWDPADPQASYMGDEYRDPVVGQDNLRRHWARLGARLRAAQVTSDPIVTNRLLDGLVLVILDVTWMFAGVEGGTPRYGRSWVSAVLRRTPLGWRFVSYMERLAELDDEAGKQPTRASSQPLKWPRTTTFDPPDAVEGARIRGDAAS